MNIFQRIGSIVKKALVPREKPARPSREMPARPKKDNPFVSTLKSIFGKPPQKPAIIERAPKKPAPKKDLLSKAIIREFNRAGRSISHFSDLFGIDKDTIEKLLDNIDRGKKLVKSRASLDKLTEIIEKPYQKLFTGTRDMDIVYVREGKDYVIRDFNVVAGARLPNDELNRKAVSYQFIISGTQDGEERYVTTHANQSIRGAMAEMEKLMQRYKKFLGGKILIRIYTPIRQNEA